MKKIIIILLCFTIAIFSFGCNNISNSSSTISSSEDRTPNIEASEYSFDLNGENAPVHSSSVTSFTNTVNGFDFSYVNATDSPEDGHVVLDKAGYVTNLDPMGDLRTVVINYDFINAEDPTKQNLYGFGYLKYRIGRNFIDNPNDYGTEIKTVGSDYTIDLSEQSGDFFISFWSPRKVEINSITITYAEDDYTPLNHDFTIQVFSTNDIHGQVHADGNYYPGLSPLTTNMQRLASQNDQFNIFIDQGDLYQGTAEAGLSNGYIMDDFLLYNGYESTTLGNHEFDWGEDRIIEHVEYSPVTILANNIRYTNTNESPEWATPYKLVSRNGVKIGIIGAVGNVRSSISASQVENINFLTGSALTNQIKKDSIALKEMGADFIILSIHDGDSSKQNNVSSLSYYDINSLSASYVNLVLESHSHQNYAFYDNKGVWHLQNYSNGSSFFLSKLKCTYKNGDYSVTLSTSEKPYYYSSTSSTKNAVIEDINEWYKTYMYGAIQSEVVGKNVPYMDDSVFESLTANLYYEYGLEKTQNTSYDIILGGGFIKTRTPYNLHSGTVVYGDIFNLLPFDNDLVLCSIKGSDLINKFISTSHSDYYVYPKNINTNSINRDATYYILTDTYTSDYASNRLTVIINYTKTDKMYARDLMAKYLRENYL